MVLGVGVIGSGFMGRTWAEVAAKHVPAISLSAVTGGRRAEVLAADYGVPCDPGPASLLSRPDVEIVIIATPPNSHLPLTVDAAAAGKHVLVEKPMARDVTECEAMVGVCDAANVRLAVVSQHRFRNAPRAAKRLIVEGAIGAIRLVRVTGAEAWWDMSVTQDQWKLDPEQQKIFADWGAHGCDVLRWLVDSRPTLAFAQYHRYTKTGPPDQSAMVMFRFASGVIADILMSFEIPSPGLGSAVQYLIIGSKGMIELDSYGRVVLGQQQEWTVAYEQPQFDPLDPVNPLRLEAYSRQLADLVGAVAEARDPLVSGQEGALTQSMLDAAERSARTDSVVELPMTAPASGLPGGFGSVPCTGSS
jgi:predicted dehydrogenase